MPLKSGAFSGGLPPSQCTFFAGFDSVCCARAVPDTAAPAATAEAFARKCLRLEFAIWIPSLFKLWSSTLPLSGDAEGDRPAVRDAVPLNERGAGAGVRRRGARGSRERAGARASEVPD